MAENTVLTFNNNRVSNNSNGVEVNVTPVEDENGHVTDTININNSQNDKLLTSSDVCTQEEAGEEFLAGENKSESDNDQHLSEAGDELLDDEVSSKSDNASECEVEDDLEDHTGELCDDEVSTPATYNENGTTSDEVEKENTNW